MSYLLRNKDTGDEFGPVAIEPVWTNSHWKVGDQSVFDEEGLVFETIAAAEPRHITNLAFRKRFLQNEKIALEMAALDDPTKTMPQRAMAADLRATMKDQEAARYIDLDRPDTRAGVLALEAAGLLAAGRALVILDAEIQPLERA
ncbi:MAG: hypothetical protein HYX47_10170 [Burkholderiales bacterium]|nr:hypothetical protein [Burkholderiales bacterium]